MRFQLCGALRRHLQLNEFSPVGGDEMIGRSSQFGNPPGLYTSNFYLVRFAEGQTVQFSSLSSLSSPAGAGEDLSRKAALYIRVLPQQCENLCNKEREQFQFRNRLGTNSVTC